MKLISGWYWGSHSKIGSSDGSEPSGNRPLSEKPQTVASLGGNALNWAYTIKVRVAICLASRDLGALVCMSRRGMPVYPGDVIICRRSCAEPWSCLFAVHFLPHDVTFTIYRWCQAPSCGGPKCTQILTVIIFCWSRDTTLFCAKLITPNSYLCIYNKNVARLSGIVARLTATTAILSRICR